MPRDNAATAIALDRVSFRYAAMEMQFDVGIATGEFVIVLGPSGAGKSTLLNLIAGFDRPTAGRMMLMGEDAGEKAPADRPVTTLFQEGNLFPHLTVQENVFYPLRVRGVSKEDASSKIRSTLEIVQLDHLAERYPKQLSGGQQQRVALARAMVFSPELLLLDEPLSALDRALRKDLQRQLKDLHERIGTTFIYVTHDQEEALSMSDRIAILREGRIEQIGSPEELYEKPASIFAANFLGKSNFLPARQVGCDERFVTYAVKDQEFRLDRDGVRSLDGDLSIVLRPERLTLHGSEEAAPANRMAGRIKGVSYFGQLYEAIVETEVAGDLLVSAGLDGPAPRAGESVWVGWKTDVGVPLPGRPDGADDAYD